jgi:hypothetical protein
VRIVSRIPSLFFLLLYWRCIVTFTTVLTMYHSQIHLLHHSPLYPLHHSWKNFSRSHFFDFHTWIQNISIIFTLLHPFPPTGTNSQMGAVLPSCSLFLKKDIFVCLNYTGISVWLLHVFMCYYPNGSPLYFSPLYLRRVLFPKE